MPTVSMPYFGLLSFLQSTIPSYFEKLEAFQCPTSGFFLFYKTDVLLLLRCNCSFQCPTSGFFLFYIMRLMRTRKMIYVSMPYFGLLSFLRGLIMSYTDNFPVFQCPTSGFFLFYLVYNIRTKKIMEFVSMPYFGLLSFLRRYNNAENV